MATCEERLDAWLEVEKQELWGTDSPFNLLEGGKESLVKKLVNVTSDVKQFPVDKAPYGLRLPLGGSTRGPVAQSDLTAAEIAHVGLNHGVRYLTHMRPLLTLPIGELGARVASARCALSNKSSRSS